MINGFGIQQRFSQESGTPFAQELLSQNN